ncbi:MAG TPA: nuclear transport factor 2 family protein [Solirubrobacterales bacterium]|nr:nuclear transport factor 2 family protein [Solirubrobacterales bacterium]
MAHSNVEVVKSVVAAFNRGDFSAAMDMLTEDVEFDWSRRMLDGEVLRGREEAVGFLQSMTELFDEIHIPSDELTDLGEGLVLLFGKARFKGRASGLDVEASAANLWTVRDGKVARFRFYQTKEDALEDAATS